jgi:hypothetical protein
VLERLMLTYRPWIAVLLLALVIASKADAIVNTSSGHTLFLASLTDDDINPQAWIKQHGTKSVEVYFNFYLEKLSKIYSLNKMVLSFMMVGACDGKSDRSIQKYVESGHWRGLFVEPVHQNVHDLRRMLANWSHTAGAPHAGSRSLVVRAAALDHCANDTVTLTRPPDSWLRDEKLPHWKSREISRVFNPSSDTTYAHWVTENVRCVTGNDLVGHWSSKYHGCIDCLYLPHQRGGSRPTGSSRGAAPTDVVFLRQTEAAEPALARGLVLDVLKVDTEGSDARVLRGFRLDEISRSRRPLLLFFEAKLLSRAVGDATMDWLRSL